MVRNLTYLHRWEWASRCYCEYKRRLRNTTTKPNRECQWIQEGEAARDDYSTDRPKYMDFLRQNESGVDTGGRRDAKLQ
jgi:hypothetical protein